MSDLWHLHRVDYRTDATDDQPEYDGMWSASIPDRALRGGQQIVGVDWSRRGWVTVTYLTPGPSPIATPEAPR